MAKKKINRVDNTPPNLFLDGGGASKFSNFINSDMFKAIQGGISALGATGSSKSSTGSGGFDALSLNRQTGTGGGGLYGAIGQSVDMTGQLFTAIDNIVKKPRKNIYKTVGLYSKGGKLFASGGGMGVGDYMNMGSTALALAGNAVQQAQIEDTEDLKDAIKSYGNQPISASNNDDLMNQWANRRELDHISWKDLRDKSLFGDFANSLSASGQGFSAGSAAGPWGAAIGGVVGGVSSLIGSIIGRRKAKRNAKKVNKLIDEANERNLVSFENQAEVLDKQNDFNLLANYSAYGGPLDMIGGALDYELAKDYFQTEQMKALGDLRMTSLPNYGNEELDAQTFAKGGGIHIKKKNRGKFTSYCGGKVTNACIQRGLHSSNPTTRKRANFARNARKWKHEDGGPLFTQGGIWSNGITTINNGGTHEQNPYEGVQIGIDPNGVPNLVEQGEVIYNDYVFSNRTKVPKNIKEKYKLTGETFADAARELQKESEERPNDPISKRGLEVGMSRLAEAQEGIRQKRGGNKFADGGDIWDPVLLDDPITAEELEAMMEEEADATSGRKGKVKNSFLRYAPVIGNGIAAFADLFSRPDYTAAEIVGGVGISPATVRYNPVGNYLAYKPLDRDFYINKLNASANATRRALQNTSGGNRAAAMAGLLAADYNYGNQLGDLARQAEEYNQQLRERVEGFNRQTNLANAEMGLKASMANAESRNKATQLRLNQAGTVAAMRQAARDAYDTRRSHNLNAFLTDLGNLGREITDRNWLDFLADKGVLKVNSKGEYVVGEKKHGGKLNRRKKKGGWRYA